MHSWIVGELAHERSVAESMNSLIDLCESARPHPDWAQLRSLPYGNLWQLFEWLQTPFSEERPTRPLRGLWFGLFNPCPDGRNPVADIYVCGSERFEAVENDNSWAVGPDWWPESRYAESDILASIFRIAYPEGGRGADLSALSLCNDAEYPLCLGYGAFAVRELLGMAEPALILGDSDTIGGGKSVPSVFSLV
jgi:hypothetical protein